MSEQMITNKLTGYQHQQSEGMCSWAPLARCWTCRVTLVHGMAHDHADLGHDVRKRDHEAERLQPVQS